MKRLFVATTLLCTYSLYAAENEKRPSWSQGLPEKSEAPEFNKPKMEMDSMEIERPTFDAGLIKPEIEYSNELNAGKAPQTGVVVEPPRPEPKSDPEPVVTQPEESVEVVEQPVLEPEPVVEERPAPAKTPESTIPAQQASTPTKTIDQSPEPVASSEVQNDYYTWEILRQYPIEVSTRILAQQNSVLLKIFINAKGDVIAVEPVLNDTSQAVVNMAERSMKRWKFVAPESLGFKQQVLSRVFKVALSENN